MGCGSSNIVFSYPEPFCAVNLSRHADLILERTPITLTDSHTESRLRIFKKLVESSDTPNSGLGVGIGLGLNGETVDLVTVADLLKLEWGFGLSLTDVVEDPNGLVLRACNACRFVGTNCYNFPEQRSEGLTIWEFRLLMNYIYDFFSIMSKVILTQPNGKNCLRNKGGFHEVSRAVSHVEFCQITARMAMECGFEVTEGYGVAFATLLQQQPGSGGTTNIPLTGQMPTKPPQWNSAEAAAAGGGGAPSSSSSLLPFVVFYEWVIRRHMIALGCQRAA